MVDSVMSKIKFMVNGDECSVGSEVTADLMLVDYLRYTLELRGTKYMCREAGCGACIVAAAKSPGGPVMSVNSCVVPVLSCQDWEITTVEKVGNKKDGYHSVQKALAKANGTQCGYCTPGWIMAMYGLIQGKKELTMLEIEESFGSNICRCTGYRPILDAFKKFGKDSPSPIVDIEDLHICEKSGKACSKGSCLDDDWCIVSDVETYRHNVLEIILKDGKKWFIVKEVNEIFEILLKEGKDSYMLASGNTSKVPYPILDYPRIIIDISGIATLKGYMLDQNLIVGAGTTLTEFMDILESVSKYEYFEYLQKLLEHMQYVGHVPVRNMGSIGGNLMMKHKNNKFASDLYLLYTTVGARLTIQSLFFGKQVVTMESFLEMDMVGKVIINVMLPPLSEEHKIQTYKIMSRAQSVHAIVNAGFMYKLGHDNVVQEARIVYGSLSEKFIRARRTEIFLVGRRLFTNATLQAALKVMDAELVVEDHPPEPSVAFRKHLALRLFYKGLLSFCPTESIHPRYRSGADKLHDSRPVSEASQIYETDQSLWPLNQPLPKLEALIQCSGEASYTDDLPVCPREVFAALVLSTVAVGEIVYIDPTKALEQPGVIAFYSAKDIPGINSFTPDDHILYTANEEVLCSGSVKYYNQPIGILVAETQREADAAVRFVTATYKNSKTPVTDVKEARTDADRNTLYTSADATNKGSDITKVIKGTNTVYGQYHFTMETIVCATKPTEEGLEVHTTTQWMNIVQLMISRALNIDESQIDVHVRRIGGGYGFKISRNILGAIACSLVSLKMNRPCRLIQSLVTNTRALGKRLPCVADFEIGVNSSGVIQYNDLKLYEDNGYKVNEDFFALAIDAVNNCYDVSKWSYQCYNTITDTAKNTWCRAPGTLEFIANCEMIMERISYELSLDPIEVRLANVDTTEYSDVVEVYKTLRSNADYDTRRTEVDKFNSENRWRKRGLRFSLLRWTPVAAGFYEVSMSVYHGDGSISITHGGIEMGQGVNTKAIQICAYFLKISTDKIHCKPTNTNAVPNGFVSGGSLTSQNIGIGVQRCCEELLGRLEPIKSQLDNPTWEELIKSAYTSNINLHVHGFFTAAENQTYNVYGAALAEVEIDVLTGESEVLRVDLIEDVGRSVNPEIDIGQVEGAFIMGLGYWRCEKLVYDSDTGELLTNRAWNYHVPLARDIPQKMNIYFRNKSYSNDAALGSKCVGEPPICMAVVVALALREAICAARLECGLPANEWFTIDGPFSVESIGLATEINMEDLKFY